VVYIALLFLGEIWALFWLYVFGIFPLFFFALFVFWLLFDRGAC